MSIDAGLGSMTDTTIWKEINTHGTVICTMDAQDKNRVAGLWCVRDLDAKTGQRQGEGCVDRTASFE